MEYKTGWCVTLYSDESQDANDNREKAHFLSWSPYDRVQITSSNEFKNLRFQNATSSYGGRRYLPYVYTEQGIIALAGVLKSEVAD